MTKDIAKKVEEAKSVGKSGLRKGDPYVELPPYLRRVLDSINEVPESRKAFERLTLRGCDRRTMLESLNAYCGGTTDEAKQALKAALNFRDRLKEAAVRLNQDADLIVQMEQDCQRLAGITRHSAVDLPSELRDFAELLAGLARAYDMNLKNVRPNREGNISAGRTWFLAELVWHIREKKATAEQYALLARLVAAVRKESEPSYCHLADTLRNAVKRIR